MPSALRELTDPVDIDEYLVACEKLDRDLVTAIRRGDMVLKRADIRYMVDQYYGQQRIRVGVGNKIAASVRDGSYKPAELLTWVENQQKILEAQIRRALDAWTETDPVSAWAKSIVGIGPVISAGLAAHIDIERSATPSALWRFAGLDPTSKWEKKSKRPWNARLKVIAWKAGQSFVKVSGNEKSFFGKLYRTRREQEEMRNERGDFAKQAKEILAAKKFDKSTVAYKAYAEGRLPPAHLMARATRYAEKVFLSCYWQRAYIERYQQEPPAPWIIAHGGHVDLISWKDVT